MDVIELPREKPEKFAVKYFGKKRGETEKRLNTGCNDPRMRTEFINPVAAHIADKLSEWGMIP